MVEVTQEDREAAAALTVVAELRPIILSGRGDLNAYVQALARHRTTALAAKEAENAELRAKVEKLREALTKHNLRAANGDEITVADELEQAAGTLEAFVAADKEAGLDGLRDCTDNDGAAYQSEWMGGLMDHATINARTLRKWAATLRATLAETQP